MKLDSVVSLVPKVQNQESEEKLHKKLATMDKFDSPTNKLSTIGAPNESQIYHNVIEETIWKNDLKEIQNKITFLEKKIQKVNSTVNILNAPKAPPKPQNPIFEVFKKHRDFIEDRKNR